MRLSTGGEGGIRTHGRSFSPYNRLAGGPNRPLWHLPRSLVTLLAEGEGFEPPVAQRHSGFQDRRLRPLGHPSRTSHAQEEV